MRLLLIHTDESIRAFLPDVLRGWFEGSLRDKKFRMECEDGNKVDHERAVTLLRAGYDCIVVNLRLPAMLSLRLAELVHLARVPARIVLMSGAPEDLGLAVPLFDEYLRIPFSERSLPATLAPTLRGPFQAQQRALSSQEHLDIAILNLLHRCDSLAPGCRGALHAFGTYRDRYLHRLPAAWQAVTSLSEASVNQRIDFFARVNPLSFCTRLGKIAECVEVSALLQTHQKKFLRAQFDHLLDAFGLTILSFRQELENVLQGLEQYGQMVEKGIKAAGLDPGKLRESLLTSSQQVPYVFQGVSRIVSLLPSIDQ